MIGVRFCAGAGKEFSLFATASRGAVVPIQLPVSPVGSFLEVKRPVGEAHLHLVQGLKLRGAIPPIPHRFS